MATAVGCQVVRALVAVRQGTTVPRAHHRQHRTAAEVLIDTVQLVLQTTPSLTQVSGVCVCDTVAVGVRHHLHDIVCCRVDLVPDLAHDGDVAQATTRLVAAPTATHARVYGHVSLGTSVWAV